MNHSLFWYRNSSYQMGNLFYRTKVYLLSQNLYLKSKFILTTFRSSPLSNYSSVTKKKDIALEKYVLFSLWNETSN